MPVVSGTGYQFSLSEIRARVRNFLLQTTASTSRWTDTNIDSYINQALDDLRLAGVCEIGRGSFTGTTGDQTKILGPEVWKVLHVTYDENYLTEVTFTDLLTMTGGDLDGASGVPMYWAVEQTDDGTMLRFDCTFGSSGKNVAYWYLKRAGELTADGDLTTLYKALSPALIYRTLVLCAKTDGDVNQAALWDAEYQNAITASQFHQDMPGESDAPETHDPYGWQR